MIRALIGLIVPLLAAALPAGTQSTAAMTRTVIVERDGLEASRVRFAAGASTPIERQLYDIVIVPLAGTLSADVDGQSAAWQPGAPIIIPRGAPHRLANHGSSAAEFVAVHIVTDDLTAPPAPDTTGVTVVRNAYSKYVRATTLRFERDGQLRGIGGNDGTSLFVLVSDADVRRTVASSPATEPVHKRAGTVWLFDRGVSFSLTNLGSTPVEIVRISAPPGR
jgi:quercetin dioxygenase-like cupin family protein